MGVPCRGGDEEVLCKARLRARDDRCKERTAEADRERIVGQTTAAAGGTNLKDEDFDEVSVLWYLTIASCFLQRLVISSCDAIYGNSWG